MLSTITLSTDTHERLSRLASAAEDAMPDVAEYLAADLDRARIVSAGDVPRNVVAMNAIVTFRDEETKRVRTVTLVFPEDEDIAAGRVSVMTPVGAALIGVTAGETIAWQTRAGKDRELTIIEVRQP